MQPDNIIELIENQRKQTFHLGLTMAGAVSAGAYTGGVMDYLMQSLDKWQRKKDENSRIWKDAEGVNNLNVETLTALGYDFRIPMHNVIIEAIGGASAGGMTSTMAMMAAVDPDYAPVETLEQANDPNHTRNNIFYESWVRLMETEKEKAMDLMLQQTDLAGKGIFSLLNVDIIDKLADVAFKNIDRLESANLKPYISKQVELLLTLTSLRGIQLSVDFSASEDLQSAALDTKLKHNMYTHTVVAHFAIDHDKLDKEVKWDYLDMKSNVLKECSIATGAFPFGLKSRHIKGLSHHYIHAALNRSIKYDITYEDFEWDKDFEFIAVDGGTMNNEPFSEVYNVLEQRAKETCDQAKGNVCHGIIMIDPFPNYADKEDYKFKDSVPDLPAQLYGSLRNEAMVKDSSVFAKKYARWMIVPFKWQKKHVAYQYPICCASLGAFGGFFDEEFRKHDFFLGRNNCRNFLRRYFTLKWEANNTQAEPVHRYWTEEMRNKFKTTKDGVSYLQIIPDMDLLTEEANSNPYDYTYKQFPSYNLKRLEALQPLLAKRIEKLVEEVQHLLNAPPKKAEKEPTEEQKQDKAELDALLDKLYPESWTSKLLPKFGWTNLATPAFFLGKKLGASVLSKIAIKTIVKDFHAKGLLGNSDKRIVKLEPPAKPKQLA